MILIVLLLGVIEGITEFLPISSTGHLIVAGHLLGFTGPQAETFEIVIQLGAILAVVWEFRRHLFSVAAGALGLQPLAGSRELAVNLAIAFLPAAVAGALLHGAIKELLFGPVTVAWALVGGGVAMLAIEASAPRIRTTSLMEVPWRSALLIGLAQTVSLFPGVSRAAATIMGGMLAGLDRTTATQFSFYLAIPTMMAATVYDLSKSWSLLSRGDLAFLALGFAAAFVSALLAVRALVRYVSLYDFRPFAWYRIALGLATLWIFRD
ncbi:MAG TPA: undecaprenyl-diphosphate phosphatase [Candidatus Polarisedimenticolia bacterium]|nr:undecaprenyl-diphosphate phosphatase [Candidatus Polarisedimenticolia bacterium]